MRTHEENDHAEKYLFWVFGGATILLWFLGGLGILYNVVPLDTDASRNLWALLEKVAGATAVYFLGRVHRGESEIVKSEDDEG